MRRSFHSRWYFTPEISAQEKLHTLGEVLKILELDDLCESSVQSPVAKAQRQIRADYISSMLETRIADWFRSI